MQTHVWVECDGYIIDITADQFDEISEKIIVTRNRNWYSTFKEQQRYTIKPPYDYFDIFKENLLKHYKNISEKVNSQILVK